MAKEGDRALRVRRWWRRWFSAVAVLATVSGLADSAAAETWRGLAVVPERRCAPYDSRDYAYSQSMEARIVGDLGMVRSPYTERCFASTRDTDIEHIVARSEAHDSGLCAADAITRRRFSSDLLNLTLASPMVNRGQKIDPRCRRLVTTTESMLVRRACHRSAPQIRSHHRPTRSRCIGACAGILLLHFDECRQLRERI